MSESSYISPAERLGLIATSLRSGQVQSPTPTVREFLTWFGAMRRGEFIVRDIRAKLAAAQLTTEPDFEGEYIDSPISFKLAQDVAETTASTSGTSSVSAHGANAEAELGVVSVGIADPTYRLSKLAAANNTPVSVTPEQSVVEAVTLMLSNDFSQLPVMSGERTVKGMISWRSIGARWALGKDAELVSEFMEDAVEVRADRSIFSALPTIVEQGYVLVRNATSKISGIVTTADLSLQFQQLAEPFLLLGEIENQVRRLIDGKFTRAELAEARDPADSERAVGSVSDLTFGEYLRLLQEPSRWAKLNLAIERHIFLKDLDAVRQIRNDVMHFDTDALPVAQLLTLRKFTKFLQALQSFGV
jgi:CBS domain-containing protein